jgi:hypothetical protein
MKRAAWLVLTLLVVLPAEARADEVTFPDRHPGLWEQSLASGASVRVTRLCVDKASDHKLIEYGFARMRQMGGKVNVTGSGQRFHVETILDLSGHTVTTEIDLQYKGDKLIESTGQSRIEPPMEGRTPISDIHEESRWTGPCPPDMAPGDVEIDGRKRNVLKEPPPGQ